MSEKKKVPQGGRQNHRSERKNVPARSGTEELHWFHCITLKHPAEPQHPGPRTARYGKAVRGCDFAGVAAGDDYRSSPRAGDRVAEVRVIEHVLERHHELESAELF